MGDAGLRAAGRDEGPGILGRGGTLLGPSDRRRRCLLTRSHPHSSAPAASADAAAATWRTRADPCGAHRLMEVRARLPFSEIRWPRAAVRVTREADQRSRPAPLAPRETEVGDACSDGSHAMGAARMAPMAVADTYGHHNYRGGHSVPASCIPEAWTSHDSRSASNCNSHV